MMMKFVLCPQNPIPENCGWLCSYLLLTYLLVSVALSAAASDPSVVLSSTVSTTLIIFTSLIRHKMVGKDK